MFISFNETIWWVFDKGTIAGVCVPIRCKGTIKTCSASGGCCCGGKTPAAATCRWLAGYATPPVVMEKSATTVEFI
jgi:hypothetical protein